MFSDIQHRHHVELLRCQILGLSSEHSLRSAALGKVRINAHRLITLPLREIYEAARAATYIEQS